MANKNVKKKTTKPTSKKKKKKISSKKRLLKSKKTRSVASKKIIKNKKLSKAKKTSIKNSPSKKNKNKKEKVNKKVLFKEYFSKIKLFLSNVINKFFDLFKNLDYLKRNVTLKDVIVAIFIGLAFIVYDASLIASKLIPYEYYNSIEFLSLVFLIPTYLIVCGFVYGIKYEFSFLIAIILSLCFIPSVFIFLKIGFMFYIPSYLLFQVKYLH